MPVLTQIPPGHSRLFISPEDWPRLRAQIETDATSARIWKCVHAKATQFLSAPELTFKPEGRRLLGQSRRCIEYVVNLAMAARLTGDERFAHRAIDEMRRAANLEDWGSHHFLDVAEMATAVAIGYDWLYDYLSGEDRQLIADALKAKALERSFNSSPEQLWWVSGTNNWNQVCHAGLTLAAVAVADLYPDLARKTVQRAIDNIPHAAHSYAPDGAYAEGPVYWEYGTTFHVLLAAALEHLGEGTHGLDEFPGFARSAEYIREVTTPLGDFYNYSDSEKRRSISFPLFWFARRFGKPDLIQYELEHLDAALAEYERTPYDEGYRLFPLTLAWLAPATSPAEREILPLRWTARGPNPIAVFRTAWDDANALFAGIKGGCASDPHAHMDAGSFVLEADGVRWTIDLDKQDYHSLEKAGLDLWGVNQDADRWKIFRLGTSSHNLLRFNGADQRVDGRAAFTHIETEGPSPHAIVNLDSIYQDHAKSVSRGLAFLDRGVLIQDEWTAGAKDVDVEWLMLTYAEVAVEGQALLLSQKGKKLALHVLAPQQVQVEVRDASKPVRPFDAPNPGVRQIRLSTRTSAGTTGMFRVLAAPGALNGDLPPLVSLKDWATP